MTDENTLKPRMLKIPDAIEYSGMSRSRLYEAAKAGQIDARKAGKRTLIVRESLDMFLSTLPRA